MSDTNEEIEINVEMEIAGAHIIQCHTNYAMDLARDVARELFLAMSDKR